MKHLALCLGLGLLLTGCMRTGAEDDETIDIPSRVDAMGRVVLSATERECLDLRVAAVEPGTLETHQRRFGRVVARPEESAFVAAPVLGRLEEALVRLGDRVTKGQSLARLQPVLDTASGTGFELRRAELAGNIEASKARIEALRAEAERVAGLVASELATGAEGVRAEAERRAEEAHLEALERASASLAGGAAQAIALVAPSDGVVSELDARPGSLLAPGQILARLLQPGPRWIDVSVPIDDPLGSSYRVQGPAGPVRASLLVRGALGQPEGTRTDRLLVEAGEAQALLPDAYLAVDVVEEVEGLRVPADAVVRRGFEDWVFVEVSAGVFEPRPIVVGAREEGEVAVVDGLAPGDRCVVRGAMALLEELSLGLADVGSSPSSP